MNYSALVPFTAAGIAILGHRRLPSGARDGLFVAGVSGALLGAAMVDPGELQTSAALIGLACAWFVVAAWVERAEPRLGGRALDGLIRRGAALHASMIAALLALACLWLTGEPPHWGRLSVALGALLIVALAHLLRRRTALASYGLAGCAAVWVSHGLLPAIIGRAPIFGSSLLWLLIGMGALGTVVGLLLRDWQARIHAWQTDPARLVDPPPKYRRTFAAVVAVSLLVGLAGVALHDRALAPISTALAALAVLTIAHRRIWNGLGEVGLGLAALALGLVPTAWLPERFGDPMFGAALAGGWMLWLARFWRQQLHDSRPWTTTGRLIPAARRVALAASAGAFLLAAVTAFGGVFEEPWAAGLSCAALLILFSMLVRDADIFADAGSATQQAATMAICAAVVPGYALAAQVGPQWMSPALLTALAGILLALRLRLRKVALGGDWPYAAYIGGFLPVAAAWLVTRNTARPNVLEIVAMLGLMLGAVAIHWHKRPEVDDTPDDAFG